MSKNYILEICSTLNNCANAYMRVPAVPDCMQSINPNQESITTCSCNKFSVSLLSYFKPKDGLPTPKGPLLLSVPSQVIALANREVTKATQESKKRGPYKKRVLKNKKDR